MIKFSDIGVCQIAEISRFKVKIYQKLVYIMGYIMLYKNNKYNKLMMRKGISMLSYIVYSMCRRLFVLIIISEWIITILLVQNNCVLYYLNNYYEGNKVVYKLDTYEVI